MKKATFSQLRNSAKRYFDAVERGESIEVYRHGKLIAIINPTNVDAKNRWKRASPMVVEGAALSEAILSERHEK